MRNSSGVVVPEENQTKLLADIERDLSESIKTASVALDSVLTKGWNNTDVMDSDIIKTLNSFIDIKTKLQEQLKNVEDQLNAAEIQKEKKQL